MIPRTLLFTDLVDSTRLVEQLGDARAAQLWAEHDRRARLLLARHRGREIDRSDGFFLLFDAVADAAQFAIGYHQAMAELGASARVGIHVGAVTLRENDAEDVARGAKPVEVEGLAKPFAARIMALARGGQTLLSAEARDALGAAMPAGSQLKSHGHYRLKGLAEPVQIFELGHDRSAFVPPPDTDKAYRVVRAGADRTSWRPLREVRHNLIAERDAFVGRSSELRNLAHQLDGGARMLTVLGPGGTGKTRLVRGYARAWLGDWPGGVYFCDLSEAKSPAGICFSVAFALGVPLGQSDPAVQLGHAIAARGRCLLILDNFEQVIEHAAPTLGHWLDRAGEAAFVITSRERLRLDGEEVFPVDPLAVDEAIELFVVRAQQQQPGFALEAGNRSAVAEVVRLLDGLPLAIELAAARVRVFTPRQLVQRMNDRFGLLAGSRGAAARQATLKTAIDWSWQLLAPWEQAALAQCSAFEGGFTMEAAEAVLDLGAWPQAQPAMDVVQSLVDKSLLRTWMPAGQGRFEIDEIYFGMYLSIHEYARGRLESAPADALRAQQRHGRYFAGFGSDEALQALARHGGAARRAALTLEIDNLVLACRRAVQRSDGAVAVACYRAAWDVFDLRGPLSLAVQLGESVLAAEGLDAASRARACRLLGIVGTRAGQAKASLPLFEQALALARQLGEHRLECRLLADLGRLYRTLGRMPLAREHLDAAMAVHHAHGGDADDRASILATQGLLNSEVGDMALAFAQLEEALQIRRQIGHLVAESSVCSNLACLYAEQGRLDEARSCFEQSLAIDRGLGDRVAEGEVLSNLGCWHRDRGDLEQAQSHFDAALAIHRSVGNRRFESVTLGDLGRLHLEQGELAPAQDCLEQSLAILREIGERRSQGPELASLAELYIRQGDLDAARATVAEAEALLRALGDKLYLAFVLCARAEVQRRAGEADAARASFDEADGLATTVGAGPQSELGRKLAALRSALA